MFVTVNLDKDIVEQKFQLVKFEFGWKCGKIGSAKNNISSGGATMKNVVVTGGSGKAGRAVVRDLMAHGYNVLNVDVTPSREPISRFLKTDLTERV